MARRTKKSTAPADLPQAQSYEHPEAKSLLRPDVGTQAQFKKKKEPAQYRYDSSFSPELDWDAHNGARELGEWLLQAIEDAAALPDPHEFAAPREFEGGPFPIRIGGLRDAVRELKRLSRPFLNWTGKAERLTFDVPTLPLFVHERLSTRAVLESVKAHRRSKETQHGFAELFGDPELPVHQQVMKAYEYENGWTNRMVLGDSLVVMNSLLRYEGLGGQVEMIYVDPPYGVEYFSNFQPFVRRRSVKHGDDDDMTREPESVKAYRDTWVLGLHSYLTYMRDRLLLARELLSSTGSIFVQISDDNLHHVREVLDELFGKGNFCALISFRKTGGQSSALLSSSVDYLLWYARDKELLRPRFRPPTTPKRGGATDASGQYVFIEPIDGALDPRAMTRDELAADVIPVGYRLLAHDTLYSQGDPSDRRDKAFSWRGRAFVCPDGTHWKPGVLSGGMQRLAEADRLMLVGNTLRYKRYVSDYPVYELDNVWDDTTVSGFGRKKEYVVETSAKVVERCLLMATRPGDLVLDPTCGSGTTAYAAEKWGRRWITIDTSRVPLALARQRLLTGVFPYYELNEQKRGPIGGFVYKRKQNKRGEDVGGIVPHVTLGSIANDEPPAEEILVGRPEIDSAITRVSGPFWFEATIPTPVDFDGDGREDSGAIATEHTSFVERMIEVLRRSPVLHLGEKKTVTLKNVRAPAKTLSLSAEALVDATASGQKATLADASQESIEKSSGAMPFSSRPVAIVFGPENGAVSHKLVYQALREAHLRNYSHLYVIGFAIQPDARDLVDQADSVVGLPSTYVQATPDLMMGDLLKNLRSSQIFSVCGLPEIRVTRVAPTKGEPQRFTVELLGLDVFDPVTMQSKSMRGEDLPCWMLDSDYNGLCFRACQVFFPRTSAWDDLKRSLRGTFDDGVWEHLAGTTSMPFEAGEHGAIAVKAFDLRGNELLVVRQLSEAKK